MFRFLVKNGESVKTELFKRACAAAVSTKKVGKKEKQRKSVAHGVAADIARNPLQDATIVHAMLQAARADLAVQRTSQKGAGLRKLTQHSTGYPKGDMLRTLEGRGIIPPLNEQSPAELRVAMCTEFYGAGWTASWAPKHASREAQDRAVKIAKSHSSFEEVRAGEAWAWEIETEQKVAEAEAVMASTLLSLQEAKH